MIKFLSHFILVVTFCVCHAFVWAETNVAEKYGCKNLHEIQSDIRIGARCRSFYLNKNGWGSRCRRQPPFLRY